MADLSFQDLNDSAEEPIFSVSGAIISIDLSKLIGESVGTDPKVSAFISRLLDLASTAQITYNANPANIQKLASYPQPIFSRPTFADNTLYITYMYQFSSRTPLGSPATETTALLQNGAWSDSGFWNDLARFE